MVAHDELAADLAQWLRGVLPPQAGLRSDSRKVQRGDAFFAYPGEHTDGRAYLPAAITRGAAAVLVEAGSAPVPASIPSREVKGLKALCGPIASHYHHGPSDALDVIAVTGTNGKTSCTQWIAQGLQTLGLPCAVIGTLGVGRADASLQDFGLTTPDALDFQAMLARLRDTDGARAIAIEASSIGLVQHRLAGTRIAIAVFTNLSRDHLDHHGTLQAYAQAKALLFAWPSLQAAVINLDDDWSQTMVQALPAAVPCIGTSQYGQSVPASRGMRVLRAEAVEQTASGMRILLTGDFGRAEVHTAVIGRYNVANLLSVTGAWLAMGYTLPECIEALTQLRPVPGRLQTVTLEHASLSPWPAASGLGAPNLPLVVVDYAHTPDALDNVLRAIRPLAQARAGALWCVFGAGGDRDPGKRPEMARVAQSGADHVVLTSDNPRSEVPERILDDIEAGLTRAPVLREADRARAIAWAVQHAQPEDLILIAGKGHETTQEVRGERRPFSDVAQAAQALALRAQGRGSARGLGGRGV